MKKQANKIGTPAAPRDGGGKSKKNEVATTDTKKGTEVAVAADDDFLSMVAGEADTYKEQLTTDDVALPFLTILQQLSPQCVEGNAEYDANAKPGMLYDTVSKTLYPASVAGENPGVVLVPIAYKSSYIEWVTRNNGGGFVNEYDLGVGSTIKTARNENNLDIIQQGSPAGTPGNQLAYTHTHFVFIVDLETGAFTPAMISMASTQVAPSKKWNAGIQNLTIPGTMKRAPRFFGLWRARTVQRQKDQNRWYVWDFSLEGNIMGLPSRDVIYQAAKEFNDSIAAGRVNIDHGQVASESNPSVDGGGDGDDKVPF